MRFRLLCYKPDIDGHLLDNLINLHTFVWNPQGWDMPQLKCSHSEIWIPNEEGLFTDGYEANEKVLGTCYTSTMGQARNKGAKYNGTCKRMANEVLYHPHRWYWYEFLVSKFAFDTALLQADMMVANNRGYDTMDIPKYFLPFRTQNPDDGKMICSGFSWWFIYTTAYNSLGDGALYGWPRLERLVKDKRATNLPSPFRLSLWAARAGYTPFSLETNIPLLRR